MLATNEFNGTEVDDINFNIFRADLQYKEQFRALKPFFCDGYTVTTDKIKTDFRNLRSQLAKANAIWKWSGQDEKDEE